MMMRCLYMLILPVMLVLVSGVSQSVQAQAFGVPAPYELTDQAEPGPLRSVLGGRAISKNSQGQNCRSRHPGVLLAVIVPCIRDTMEAMAIRMTAMFSAIVVPIMWAFITLVIVIFGVQLLNQEADMKKDGFSLLFKIGVVVMMTDNFGGFIPDTFAILRDLSELVSGILAGMLGGLECVAFPGESPWRYYDCIIASLFGFAPGYFVGTSLIALVPAAFHSGQFGVMIFMAGIAAFLYILRLIIRVTYIYLMAVVALSFMIVVSPLFIPLLLLKKTESYFSRWLHAFMSLIGQPVIVLAFMAFAIAVINLTLYDTKFGIIYLLTQEYDPEEWQAEAQQQGSSTMVADCQNYFLATGTDLQEAQGTRNIDYTSGFLSCASQLNWLSESQYILDFGTGEADITQRLFFGLAMLVLICYLLLLMVNTLMSIAAIMFGGAFYLGEAVRENPFEHGLNTMQQQMGGSWSNSISGINSGNASAGQAAAGFAGAGGRSAIQGFLSGMGSAMGIR